MPAGLGCCTGSGAGAGADALTVDLTMNEWDWRWCILVCPDLILPCHPARRKGVWNRPVLETQAPALGLGVGLETVWKHQPSVAPVSSLRAPCFWNGQVPMLAIETATHLG